MMGHSMLVLVTGGPAATGPALATVIIDSVEVRLQAGERWQASVQVAGAA